MMILSCSTPRPDLFVLFACCADLARAVTCDRRMIAAGVGRTFLYRRSGVPKRNGAICPCLKALPNIYCSRESSRQTEQQRTTRHKGILQARTSLIILLYSRSFFPPRLSFLFGALLLPISELRFFVFVFPL